MAEKKNPKTGTKELVDTLIPDDEFAVANNEHQIFVSVNFKNYLVESGGMVKVPPEVKEVIDNSVAAKKSAQRRAAKVAYSDPTPANT
ncbi:MAG: hypothetical protein IJ725_02875 [Ruminococcus sp.]|nr:hypothetical protein [Ruminococcus sp.]